MTVMDYKRPIQNITDEETVTFSPLQEPSSGSQRSTILDPKRIDQPVFRIPLPKNKSIAWISPVLRRINAISSLSDNWNSHGAKAVEVKAIVTSLHLLVEIMDDGVPIPAIVPTNSGGIQLEWHKQKIDIEIFITAQGQCRVCLEDLVTGKEWEGSLNQYSALFLEMLDRIKQF